MHKYNEVRQIRRRLLGSIECFVLVCERGGVMTSHVEPVVRLSLRSSVTNHQRSCPRQSSLPIRVTGAEDARRWDPCFRSCLPVANALQPRAYGRPGCDTLQFATEEFLHGLASERRAYCEFITDFLGHTPDGDLNCHERIMPSLTAFGNQPSLGTFPNASSGTRCDAFDRQKDNGSMETQPLICAL